MAGRNPELIKRRGIAAATLIVVVFLGCSAEKRYKVLSTVFDGVPDPNAPLDAGTRRGTRERPVFIHKPFADQKCDACHLNTDDIFARAKVRKDVCLECHAKVQQAYAVMHGPVSAGACTQCHAPHQSGNEHLIKLPAPGLCMKCHEQDFLSISVPEHTKPKSNCLSCHSGHGGTDRNFLKTLVQQMPATSPATQPARARAGA
jgi:predicted CXXCH cytochrome family protein